MDILFELIFNLFTVRKSIREDYNKLTSVQKIIYYLLWLLNFGLVIVLNSLSYMDINGEYDFKISLFLIMMIAIAILPVIIFNYSKIISKIKINNI